MFIFEKTGIHLKWEDKAAMSQLAGETLPLEERLSALVLLVDNPGSPSVTM